MTQGMNFQYPNYQPTQVTPNAVSINIYSPQAYGNGATSNPVSQSPNGFYSLYGQNPNPAMNYYPNNYNNMFQQAQFAPQQQPQTFYEQAPAQLQASPTAVEQAPQVEKETTNETKEEKKADKKVKTKVPLTDDYIKSLENYLNDSNKKVRLIAAKEILERFKEDENRKDNPSLMALLNKCLRDTSAPVRFLALTALQLGHALGNDETVQILKEIQSAHTDKLGEDQLLASEILLKMAGGQPVEIQKENS